MRVLIQVVNNANVKVEEKIVGQINNGYLIFVGFSNDDNNSVIEKMVEKIINLRILPDENGKTNLSLIDKKGEILSVSQFALYANTRNGRRPDFINAAKGELAEKLYNYFNFLLKKEIEIVQTGMFGEDMNVSLENSGPFTIYLDSKLDLKA